MEVSDKIIYSCDSCKTEMEYQNGFLRCENCKGVLFEKKSRMATYKC